MSGVKQSDNMSSFAMSSAQFLFYKGFQLGWRRYDESGVITKKWENAKKTRDYKI